MGELLDSIKNKKEHTDINKLMNIVIIHSQSKSINNKLFTSVVRIFSSFSCLDDFIKSKALVWMNELIILAGSTAVKFSSGIVEAILPTLAYEDLAHNNILLN